MSIEDKIKEMILARFGSVKTFAEACSLPYGTVDTILRRGINKASVTNIITMCQTLGISTDKLAMGEIGPREKIVKFESEITDFHDVLEYARNHKSKFSKITIDNIPLSEKELDSIIDCMELAAGIIRNKRNNENERI